MSEAPSIRKMRRVRYEGAGEPREESDALSVEEPLEIRVRGAGVSVTMRTPGHDAELAAGFLMGEGLLRHPSQIAAIEPCRQGGATGHANILNVFLTPDVPFDAAELQRNFYASSSCGVCGKASLERVYRHFAPVADGGWEISRETIRTLPEKLRQAQEVFERTGSLHAAGLFDRQGNLLCVREDVGRHNAVDKVLGWAFLRGLPPLADHVLFVSGRTSFEIVQKALAAGVPVVAAVSGPSSLAVALAAEGGMTLIGFLRGETFNVYSHAGRVG
ncbi:MAG: formate dehydrogenase accessory sulfurtransferase FdhD [Verrucomicrobiae bacterium]|nr:formate dehydrogenase accessory sulfurtransferase FdhD [Verrucomicrobiae bacterium]